MFKSLAKSEANIENDVVSGHAETCGSFQRSSKISRDLTQNIADRRLRVPETGAESFEILAEAQLVSRELGGALALMVGFRNILVHDYARLDSSIVLRVLREDLRDLERFRDAVGPLL